MSCFYRVFASGRRFRGARAGVATPPGPVRESSSARRQLAWTAPPLCSYDGLGIYVYGGSLSVFGCVYARTVVFVREDWSGNSVMADEVFDRVLVIRDFFLI